MTGGRVGRGRVTGVVVAVLAVGTVLLGGVLSPASAHSELLASTPTSGDLVSPGVGKVELVFGEDLVPGASEVVVRGPGGDLDGAAAPRVDGATIAVELPRLSPGTHVVAYRVTSVDGHPVAGQYTFTVRAPGASPGPGAGSSEPLALGAPVAGAGVPLGPAATGPPTEPPTAPLGRWILGGVVLSAIVLGVHRVRVGRTDAGGAGRVV